MNIRYPIYEGVYRILTFKNSNNSLSHSINCWSIDIELDNFY